MNTFKTHARPSWIVGCSRGISERAPGLDANDGARFIGILSASRLIRRHADLLRWLEEMRAFLPHQILIAAWGDFQRGNVKCEVVSHLPGLRAVQGRGCALDDLLHDAYTQWIRSGREPLVLTADAAATLRKPCGCAPAALPARHRAAQAGGIPAR